MNYKRLKDAKEWYQNLMEFGDNLQEKGWIDLKDDWKYSELLRSDVADYIAFLIAADDQINSMEVDVFHFITNYGDDLDSLKHYIENNDVTSYNFQSNPPLSLVFLLQALNKYLLDNSNSEEMVSISIEQYVMAFLTVGKEVIQADERVSYAENRDYQTYINTIKQYIEENAYVSLKGTLATLLNSMQDLIM